MAKRGRKPKPLELKILSGTNRGAVPSSPGDGFAAGVPEKPAMVAADEIASAEWDRVAGELAARRILSTADRGILTSYCNAFSRLHKAWALCDAFEIRTKDGAGTKGNPAVPMAAQASKDLASFASELGLTPASRSRVAGASATAVDGFEEFLKEGG